MLDKLQALEDKYLDLEAKISDPDVIADQKEWQKCTKAHAKLTDIVTVFREYRDLMRAKADAEEIIDAGDDKELTEMAYEELKELKPQLAAYEERLTILLLPSDPNDDKDVIVEIRGGAGGDEAALFAGVLFRMYTRYAEARGWRTEILDANPTELGGFKEVVFQISGDGVYGRMKFESGVHRVQRVPETESGGRIHTSTITVAVMPEVEDVDVVIDDKGNVPLPAQGLQLLGFFQKFALIQRLFPKLDHGDAAIQTLLDHVHQRPTVQPVTVGDGIQQQIFGITFHIEHLCIF